MFSSGIYREKTARSAYGSGNVVTVDPSQGVYGCRRHILCFQYQIDFEKVSFEVNLGITGILWRLSAQCFMKIWVLKANLLCLVPKVNLKMYPINWTLKKPVLYPNFWYYLHQSIRLN